MSHKEIITGLRGEQLLAGRWRGQLVWTGFPPPDPEQGFLGQFTAGGKILAATAGEKERNLPIRPLVAVVDGKVQCGDRGPGPETVGRGLLLLVLGLGLGDLLGLAAAAAQQREEHGGGEGEQQVTQHVSKRAESDWGQRGVSRGQPGTFT